MFVEGVRLFVVVLGTAGGFWVARDFSLATEGVGGILDRLCECTAEHFDVRHATFQVEPVSHQGHEDLGEVH